MIIKILKYISIAFLMLVMLFGFEIDISTKENKYVARIRIKEGIDDIKEIIKQEREIYKIKKEIKKLKKELDIQ